MLAGLALFTVSPALAQDADEAAEEGAIVVTGYRAALQNSTIAKRNSNGFSDVIFADDIGKLPSQNLAESLNRVPGVIINRGVVGEGRQISVRGLGPSFTKVVLNGNNIWLAADGGVTGTNSNRQNDLDVFPAELFSSLVVDKTPYAHHLEGGTSGYIDLRTTHPFDNPGQQFRISFEEAYTEINEEFSPIVSGIYSNTFNDRFGVLFGAYAARRKFRVDGYETVGYSDGCVEQFTGPAENPTQSSNCDGSGPWLGRNLLRYSPFATQEYVDAHPGLGLAVGDPIDPVADSGLTRDELDHGILPYLGRGMFAIGDRDATTLLGSFQFRPNDRMEFVFDILYAETERKFDRLEAMNWGRRNFMSLGAAWNPENLSIDSNQVITEATLYNTHVWVGHRAYIEEFDFTSYMPSLTWDIADGFRAELTASVSESDMFRDEPYFLYLTPATTVHYEIAGVVPTFDYNVDISQPDIGWVWNDIQGDQIRFQRNIRHIETTGLHADFLVGDDPDRNGFRFGVHYDEANRDLDGFAGATTQLLKDEHLFPSDAYANIADFLLPSPVSDLCSGCDGDIGYTGIAVLDVGRFKENINYDGLVPIPGATGDQFGQGVGDIEEKITALYAENNLETDLFSRPLRTNVGFRWVNTEQTLSSFNAVGDIITSAEYERFLPSFSAVYDLTDDIKLRASASRTLTRANPGEMYPNSVWTTSGIESARAGNPNLDPFESTNFDIGGEYYYGDLGYVSLNYFEKEVSGFTLSSIVDVVFEDIGQYGLDPDNISDSQQDALVACGGPSVCTVAITTRVNCTIPEGLSGFESVWVMPLDFIVEGLGFNASVTKIEQDPGDPDCIVTGIPDWSYAWTGFFENDWFQGRVTYYHQDGAVTSGFVDSYNGSPNFSTFPTRRNRSDDRTQLDFSLRFALPMVNFGDVALTVDGYNVTNEPVRTIYEHDNINQDIFYPGATYTFGLRGNF